jgi:cytochrome c biogenesis protein CcdA
VCIRPCVGVEPSRGAQETDPTALYGPVRLASRPIRTRSASVALVVPGSSSARWSRLRRRPRGKSPRREEHGEAAATEPASREAALPADVLGECDDHAVAKLVLAIILIALPDAVNPSLILTELLLVAGPHPRRSTAVFTVAAIATTFAGGLALALGLGDVILSLLPKPSAVIKDAVTAAAGGLLITVGLLLWIRRERAVARVYSDRPPDRAAAALGAGIAGVELLSALPYFAAIALIVGSDVSDVHKVILLLLYNVVYALPLIAIAAVTALAEANAQRLLAPITSWLMRHWPALVASLSVIVGIALAAYGGARLTIQ